jgi:small-conductance mechanosensitive channel
VSEEGRELLATGRFTVPLESEGFGSLEGLAPPRRAKPAARVSAAEKQREAKAALRDAKARVRELEAAAREAEQRAEALERDAAKARRLADRARAAAEETRRSLGL